MFYINCIMLFILIFRAIFNMYQNDNTQFSGEIFREQGAYLSTFTPHTIQQYLTKPIIPSHSYYHLVGCCNPLLLAKSNIASFLDRYITSSKQLHNTLIDICLPFSDPQSVKVYMARYIIFRGQILGIRLNTNAVDLWPQYNSWPKHKIKRINLSINGSKYDTMIGQFYLHLHNARIGLLFNDQLKTRTSQYINSGFQLISLTHCSNPNIETIRQINLISKNSLILEAYLNNNCSKDISKIKIEDIFKYVWVNNDHLLHHKIYIQYYSLEQIYANKQFLHLESHDFRVLDPLNIDLLLAQPKEQIYNPLSSQYEILASSNHQQLSQFQASSKELTINSVLINMLLRLSKLCQLQISKTTKILIILQQTIQTLTFCYLLNLLSSHYPQKIKTILNKLKFIIIKNHQLLSIIDKLTLFENKITTISRRLIRQKQSLQFYLLRVIKQMNSEDQVDNQFYIFITKDYHASNVIQMINKNSDYLRQGGDIQEVILEKTWLIAQIFSSKEIQYIFTNQIKIKFEQDKDYLTWVYNKKISQSNDIFYSNHKLQNSQLYLNQEVIQLLKKDFDQKYNSLESYQKTKLINKQKKSLLFAHFLFRRINKISIKTLQNQSYLLNQIIRSKPQNLLQIFSILTARNSTIFQSISHQQILNKIIHSRRQQIYMKKCHKCQFLYLPELVYKCNTKQCGQIYCYQCLRMMIKGLQLTQNMQFSTAQQINKIKLCPVCRNICHLSNCKPCKQRNEMQKMKSQTKTCQICMKQAIISYLQCKMVACKKIVCANCISNYYRYNINNLNSQNWICFCCKKTCKCNRCQLVKRENQIINNQLFKNINKPEEIINKLQNNKQSQKVINNQSKKNNLRLSCIDQQSIQIKQKTNQQKGDQQATIKFNSKKPQLQFNEIIDQITQKQFQKSRRTYDRIVQKINKKCDLPI